MSPGTYDPNQNIYVKDWETDPNVELYEEQTSDNYDLDVLLGGVVCKGFSLAGIRNPYDERNYLYLEQLRLVEIFKPKMLF